MKAKASRLFEEALTLPQSTRADLAGRLLDSVDVKQLEPDWDQAWAAEVGRRVESVRSGKARLVPWSDVRRNILRSRREAKRHPVSRAR